MRFERNLIHRCTLVLPKQKIGETEYGKPIYRDLPVKNVPCRSTEIKRIVSRDQYGVNFITENILFLSASQDVEEEMKVKDITDRDGKPVLMGTYRTEECKPIYGRVRLHHYEVTLQKESDGNG